MTGEDTPTAQHHDDDLWELSRMLPVPGPRDFPVGRHHQMKEQLMNSWKQMARKDGSTAIAATGGWLAWPRRRRVLTLTGTLAGAGALSLGVSVLLPGTTAPAMAATPKPLSYIQDSPAQDAPQILDRLADIAARQPDATVTGTEHIKSRGWYMNTRVGEKTATAVVPVEDELWQRPDGTAVTIRRDDAPEFPDQAYRVYWKEQGWATGPGKAEIKNRPADELPRHWADRPPTDPQALKSWLQKAHPAQNGPAETLVAVTDLIRERVLSAPERAALLRVLATVPGLTYEGTTVDRAGRTGKAFSLDNDLGGLPNRHTVIVDPGNGRIIDDEKVLTETAGRLAVPIPSLTSYTAYLEADTQAAPTT
ncbi:CU044_5270 family protein [Kitasatospora sp. NPDC008050]|uniref:CU044_5270 family protein n=1 Tax=Kitasatospora sp. NPDC008050 TaxID=3364021 RepID=UPI0036E62ADB